MDIDTNFYHVIYRKVKYPRIELRTGKVVLILPEGEKVDRITEKYSDWIEKKRMFISEVLKEAESKELFHRKWEDFERFVQDRVSVFSNELNIKDVKIVFRLMKTKWASMSKRKRLTVNTLVRFLPDEHIEYILFHELAHVIENKHNERFWKIIRIKFENYVQLERDLFAYWFLTQRKLL